MMPPWLPAVTFAALYFTAGFMLGAYVFQLLHKCAPPYDRTWWGE